MLCHFSNMDGKAAKRAGESEDLSELKALKPLKNAIFCLSSRRAKILTTDMH